MGEHHRFNIIDRNLSAWDGSPVTLEQGQGVSMPQTPVGDLVLAYQNLGLKNDMGTLSLTSGGSEPLILPVEPLMNAPNISIENYEGNNLNLTNISATGVPIYVAAWGPGFGNPGDLPADRIFYSLRPYQSRTTRSKPQFQRLALRALGQYTVFVTFIGSTPSVYCVNAPDEATVPVGDYTEVTSSNTFPVVGNWLGRTLYVVNLSPLTSQNGEVSLTDL